MAKAYAERAIIDGKFDPCLGVPLARDDDQVTEWGYDSPAE
jgi:hypothetical protein